MTDNEELADAIRSLRVHEQGSNKYDNVRTCLAFDTIQAAILNEKLKIFCERNRRPATRSLAATTTGFPTRSQSRLCRLAQPRSGHNILFAYRGAMGLPRRSRRKAFPTAIYYPIPVHRQRAYKHFFSARAALA